MKNIENHPFSAFSFGLSLHAAVDEINSYFTVSQHAAALGTVVDVTIYLRDENNNPVRAANIAVESSSFDVTVVEEPKAGSNGRYRARIKADVHGCGFFCCRRRRGNSGEHSFNPALN